MLGVQEILAALILKAAVKLGRYTTKTMHGDGDLNGMKLKLDYSGSPSNTLTPQKPKLDTDKKENLEHSAKWPANKSELEESPGITSMPKRQKLDKDPDGKEKCGTATEVAYT